MKAIFKQTLAFFWFLIIFTLKTITIDLSKNIKKAWTYGFYPNERKKMKREIELKNKVELMDERLKTVERLAYAVIEDIDYLKSEKGKHDARQLKKEVK